MKQQISYISAIILFVICFCVTLFPGITVSEALSPRKVYVIPIAGDVEPGMAAYLKRALRDVEKDALPLIIIEMDTFGGRVDAALDMVDTLVNSDKGRTIAYVSKKAISAGALIALACNELVMKPNTTIGDCAPISFTKEGPKMAGEKYESPLRAKFRALAKRNHYPGVLAEAMVSQQMEVYKVIINGKIRYMDSIEYDELSAKEKKQVKKKKTIVAKGELLTMDDVEALELGFSSMSASGIDEMLKKMGISGYEIIRFEETWSENFVRFITKISGILLMIGLAALYMEIKAPGFGAPGIIGIICLALVFLNQYLVGLADYTELLVIVGGIVLLGFEVFVIPGFGIAGITGLLFIGAGFILAFQDFVIPDPTLPWEKNLMVMNVTQVMGSFLIAFIVSLAFLRYVFPKLSIVTKGPYLDATLRNAHSDSRQLDEIVVGDKGIADSFLRPSGRMRIKTGFFDVITEGEFIERGTPIKVLYIKGNRIIVTKA